jgi:hypothetical protein
MEAEISIYTYILKSENTNRFNHSLANINWELTLSNNCADSAYTNFLDTFNNLHQFHFQPKVVKFNKNFHRKEKWFTRGLLISRITKLKLEKIAASSQLATDLAKYKNYRNLFNTLVKLSKKLHFQNELYANKGNLKKHGIS